MLKELVKLANHLDAKGLSGEADLLDKLLFKMAAEDSYLWAGRSTSVNEYAIELPKDVRSFLGEEYDGLVVAESDEGSPVDSYFGENWIEENNFNLERKSSSESRADYSLYENDEGLRVAELDLGYSEEDPNGYFLIIPKAHAAPAPPEGFMRDEMVEELNFDSGIGLEF